MVKLKSTETSALHQAVTRDFKSVLEKYKDQLTGHEMLALASHLVGVLIALQDQHKYKTEDIWEVVGKNIEAGNVEAIQESLGKPEGNA